MSAPHAPATAVRPPGAGGAAAASLASRARATG